MTTKRLAELDERDHQGETVSAAAIQRDVALFDSPDGDHCRALVAP